MIGPRKGRSGAHRRRSVTGLLARHAQRSPERVEEFGNDGRSEWPGIVGALRALMGDRIRGYRIESLSDGHYSSAKKMC